ncbi:MAG: hypothetical protein KZQ85_14725 [Candidatus Thiodiazotropha sp. (ex Myrtea sp. 'scaly one' KF741663)]|nr:hypothetical protein [Candidatus Thiodiazotropha sp. (ex Myrtea sp. 'scaly one' KF741663)]
MTNPLTDEEVAAVVRSGASVAEYANRRLGLGRESAGLSGLSDVEVGQVTPSRKPLPKGLLGRIGQIEL